MQNKLINLLLGLTVSFVLRGVSALTHMADASAKELWNAVGKSTNTSKRKSYVTRLLADPDAVNPFFAAISSTTEYSDSNVLSFKECVSESENMSDPYITAVEVELLLRRVKNTSPGVDNVPSWVFRYCSLKLVKWLLIF